VTTPNVRHPVRNFFVKRSLQLKIIFKIFIVLILTATLTTFALSLLYNIKSQKGSFYYMSNDIRQDIELKSMLGIMLVGFMIPAPKLRLGVMAIAFAALIGTLGLAGFSASAAESATQTVAEINQNKASLAGKSIRAEGKVVKVNNGIMGRNFVHLRDGTGEAAAGTHNLMLTSKQTAAVGDQVSITGVVVLNRDFGSGYMYPLLIEEATITPKK